MDADLPSLAPEPSTLSEHGWQVPRKTGDRGYREPASEKVQITAIEGSWGRVLLRFADGCILTSLLTPFTIRVLSNWGFISWLLFCGVLSALWASLRRPRPRQIELAERQLYLKERQEKVTIGPEDLGKILVKRPKNGLWDPFEAWVAVVLDYYAKPRQVFGPMPKERAEAVAQLLAKELEIGWESESFETSLGRWGFRAVGVVTLFLMTAAWLALWHQQELPSKAVDLERTSYQPGIHLLRDELALKSVGVRRCAKRLGHLPESLAECESDIASTSAWLYACRAHDEARGEYGRIASWLAAEADPDNLSRDVSASRKGWQDALGLPVIYHPGKRQVEGIDNKAQFSSDDPLPPLVQRFGQARDAALPNSQEPFVLSSVTVQGIIDYTQNTGLHYGLGSASAWTSLVGLFLGGLSLMIRYQGGKLGRAVLILLALAALSVGLAWETPTIGPHYHPDETDVAFDSLFWLVPPEWRLEMMLHAPWDQKIPAEFREKAEDYIQNSSQENWR